MALSFYSYQCYTDNFRLIQEFQDIGNFIIF